MTDSSLPIPVLDQLREAERLLALDTIAHVSVVHDPMTDEWVVEITPTKQSPGFAPFKRFNIPSVQIDAVVREGWAAVAHAAQQENQRTLEEVIEALEPTIPVNSNHEPGLSHWLPTDIPGEWESPKGYVIWHIGPNTISSVKQVSRLIRAQGGFELVLPDNQKVLVKDAERAHGDNPSSDSRIASSHIQERFPNEIVDDALDLPDQDQLIIPELRQTISEKDFDIFIDQADDIDGPKGLGLLTGLVFGSALTVFIAMKLSTEIGAAYVLTCVAIWIIKRISILITRRR